MLHRDMYSTLVHDIGGSQAKLTSCSEGKTLSSRPKNADVGHDRQLPKAVSTFSDINFHLRVSRSWSLLYDLKDTKARQGPPSSSKQLRL